MTIVRMDWTTVIIRMSRNTQGLERMGKLCIVLIAPVVFTYIIFRGLISLCGMQTQKRKKSKSN